MTTPDRPTLGEIEVQDKHEHWVIVQLTGLGSLATGTYSRGAEVRIQPQILRLVWKGAPAELQGAWLSGPELTKSGARNARDPVSARSYITREYGWETDPITGFDRLVFHPPMLAEDTPDWIRELIVQYAPDWPELDERHE